MNHFTGVSDYSKNTKLTSYLHVKDEIFFFAEKGWDLINGL